MASTVYTRITAAGNIKASPGRLYALIILNPDSSARHCILNDATSGTGSEVAKFLTPSKQTKVYLFGDGITLHTGIRIGTFEDSDTIVTGIYD